MFLLQSLVTSLLAFSAAAKGQADKKPPAAPGLSYLYSLNCTLAPPIAVGSGPHGTRTVIPIVGGTFSGPKLNGIWHPATIHPRGEG
jgi:hypothetical protein